MTTMVPLLAAAGTAVLVLLTDLLFRRWAWPFGVALLGAVATGAAAGFVQFGQVDLLVYVFDDLARLVAVLMAALTAAALLLYVPVLRSGDAPAGEVGFLLACAMTGGVVLGGVRDLVTLIVALETLTLPLYALVALHRRRAGQGASAALTFFTTSIIATAVSLLGAALLYLQAGTVALPGVMREQIIAGGQPLAVAGVVLLLAGFGFKVAAVPLHAWAPSTYDGAPIPLAAFLSTASKLGGVVAILFVVNAARDSDLAVEAGITVGALATASLLVGTLVALRQQRTVRLLAWSSVAQAGFILAPLGGLALAPDAALLAAALAYTMFFLALEIGAFSGVATLRATSDGGSLDDMRGLGRSVPWRSAMLSFALIGLAGLPPALAGLFAKITVLKALLDVGMIWLAVLVALMSVVGLAVYWRPLAALYRSPVAAALAPVAPLHPAPAPGPAGAVATLEAPAVAPSSDVAVAPAVRSVWSACIPLIAATLLTAVLSVAPQSVLSLWP